MPTIEQQHKQNQAKDERRANLPVAQNEDVEYSQELADADDVEAQVRAKAADRRAMDARQSAAVAQQSTDCEGL